MTDIKQDRLRSKPRPQSFERNWDITTVKASLWEKQLKSCTMLTLPKGKTVSRNLVLVFLLLALLDQASSAQSNQEGRVGDLDGGQLKQVTSVFVTGGNRYHSDYFDFTYSLPHDFVDNTEQYKSLLRGLPYSPPFDRGELVLLSAEKRTNESADPVAVIMVTVEPLSRYPESITEKDFMHKAATDVALSKDDVLQEGKQVEVSGWSFFRADYKINHPKSGYLTVMVVFRKDFVVLWQFSAHSKEQVDSITSSMLRELITK